MKNPENGRSRGFGFVQFKQPSYAEKVLEIPEHILDSKKIDPKRCTPKKLNQLSKELQELKNKRKVFIGGLLPTASEESIRTALEEKQVKVEEVIIMRETDASSHRKGSSRGFGFVTFENDNDCEKIIANRHLTILGKEVEVKPAEPKNKVPPAGATPVSKSKEGASDVRVANTPSKLPHSSMHPISKPPSYIPLPAYGHWPTSVPVVYFMMPSGYQQIPIFQKPQVPMQLNEAAYAPYTQWTSNTFEAGYQQNPIFQKPQVPMQLNEAVYGPYTQWMSNAFEAGYQQASTVQKQCVPMQLNDRGYTVPYPQWTPNSFEGYYGNCYDEKYLHMS